MNLDSISFVLLLRPDAYLLHATRKTGEKKKEKKERNARKEREKTFNVVVQNNLKSIPDCWLLKVLESCSAGIFDVNVAITCKCIYNFIIFIYIIYSLKGL